MEFKSKHGLLRQFAGARVQIRAIVWTYIIRNKQVNYLIDLFLFVIKRDCK